MARTTTRKATASEGLLVPLVVGVMIVIALAVAGLSLAPKLAHLSGSLGAYVQSR